MRYIIWHFKKFMALFSYDYSCHLYGQLVEKSYQKRLSNDEGWWMVKHRYLNSNYG